jgi:hypothetical protein
VNLENQAEIQNLIKYGTIFMKHKDNPVLKKIIKNNSTFADEMALLYRLNASSNAEDITLAIKNDDSKNLTGMLLDFIGDGSELRGFSYETILDNKRTTTKNWRKEIYKRLWPTELAVLGTIISGYLNESGSMNQPGLTIGLGLTGIGLCSYMVLKPSKVLPALLDRLHQAASTADQYLPKYKMYLMVKELEVTG